MVRIKISLICRAKYQSAGQIVYSSRVDYSIFHPLKLQHIPPRRINILPGQITIPPGRNTPQYASTSSNNGLTSKRYLPKTTQRCFWNMLLTYVLLQHIAAETKWPPLGTRHFFECIPLHDRRIPLTKDQLCGKRLHMTPPWHRYVL